MKNDSSIKINDLVRSYDFPEFMPGGKWYDLDMNDRDRTREGCYVEGIVVDITSAIEGCPRYRIRVTKRVFSNVEEIVKPGAEVLPPVNGIPTTFGGITCGVVKV
jgi:hypothetical protein